jgi:hypothetical protein
MAVLPHDACVCQVPVLSHVSGVISAAHPIAPGTHEPEHVPAPVHT